jgi:hypothetical protein
MRNQRSNDGVIVPVSRGKGIEAFPDEENDGQQEGWK